MADLTADCKRTYAAWEAEFISRFRQAVYAAVMKTFYTSQWKIYSDTDIYNLEND